MAFSVNCPWLPTRSRFNSYQRDTIELIKHIETALTTSRTPFIRTPFIRTDVIAMPDLPKMFLNFCHRLQAVLRIAYMNEGFCQLCFSTSNGCPFPPQITIDYTEYIEATITDIKNQKRDIENYLRHVDSSDVGVSRRTLNIPMK